jgi:hypothetical protein
MRTFLLLGLVCQIGLSADGHFVDNPDSKAPDRAPLADRAIEAMRREALAAAAAREAEFKRLAALPALPPIAAQAQLVMGDRILLRRIQRAPAGEPFLVRGADELGDLSDPDLEAGAEPRYAVAEESFNLFLLGTTGDTDSVQAYFTAVLDRRIKDVARTDDLTTGQRRKLQLAGRGDIKRLLTGSTRPVRYSRR